MPDVPTPARPVLEEMAGKASGIKQFGKPVDTLDDVEMKAAIWAGVRSRLDAHGQSITPLLGAVEHAIRMIEADGFQVEIIRTYENDQTSLEAVIKPDTLAAGSPE